MKAVDGKQVYSTEYKQDGSTYGSYFWAKSPEHAARLARIRGLNEEILGCFSLHQSETWVNLRLKRKGKAHEQRLHYLTFLSFVALKSGLYTVDRVMGDKGWYHEYIHRLHISDEPLNKSQKEIDHDIYTAEKLLGFTP